MQHIKKRSATGFMYLYVYVTIPEKEDKMDQLLNLSNLEDVLSELNSENAKKAEDIFSTEMSEEMQASQRRYLEYMKNHAEQQS